MCEVPWVFRAGPRLGLGATGKEGRWLGRGGVSPRRSRAQVVRIVLDDLRPIAHVAREVGTHDTTLGNWVRDYRRRHDGDAAEGPAGGPGTAREREPEHQVRELCEENGFGKSGGLLRSGASVTARYEFISSECLGRHRWVIERTLAWLLGYRRLAVR
jgi:transposase